MAWFSLMSSSNFSCGVRMFNLVVIVDLILRDGEAR